MVTITQSLHPGSHLYDLSTRHPVGHLRSGYVQ
jgi:hypothetical protein